MDRLTEYRKDLKRYEYKQDENGYCFIQEGQIVNKLGQLEDLMEKYEIRSIEELEEIIKENQKLKSKLSRWLELLETDGIDSKNMVACDIQAILKEVNK